MTTQRTSSMTHFTGAAEEAISIMKSKLGLATKFFNGVLSLEEEVKAVDILNAFDMSMVEVEEVIKKDLPVGKTLSDECVSWRSRKSGMRSALELGLEAKNFKSCRAMMDAATQLRKEQKEASEPAVPVITKADALAPTASEVAVLHSATSSFTPAVQAKIDKFLTDLEGLSEVGQLDTMKFAEGTIGKLKKQGGRFVHLKTA